MEIEDDVKYSMPEQYLIYAIIERALCDLNEDKTIKRKALGWLLSQGNQPFSFKWCLDAIECSHYYDVIIEQVVSGKIYEKIRLRV
jgi:hypothetical protein